MSATMIDGSKKTEPLIEQSSHVIERNSKIFLFLRRFWDGYKIILAVFTLIFIPLIKVLWLHLTKPLLHLDIRLEQRSKAHVRDVH